MADKDAMLKKLNSMSQSDLQRAVIDSAKKIGAVKHQLKQKDKLIADFTSQREKTKREADKIIASAKEQAQLITEDAEKKEAQAKKRIEEVDAEVARKLTNANAAADSIVESRLNEAKSEIEKIEARREEAKHSAIALNKNIIERYDTLITEVEEQISRFKDMQESLNDFNVDIEAEDFKKFNMSDYVTTTKPEKKATVRAKDVVEEVETTVKPILDVDNDDTELNDEDLEALAYVFDDEEDFDEVEEEEVPDLDDSELISDDDLAFLKEDFDFSELSFDDEETDEVDDDDIFADGKMKSFTDSFMAVRASDDDDDDLDDLDIDSILDDDDETEVDETPKVNIPARRRRRSNRSNPSHWISQS